MDTERAKNFIEIWSWKKVLLGVIVLLIIAAGIFLVYKKLIAKNDSLLSFFNSANDSFKNPSRAVEGISIDPSPSLKKDAEAVIEKVKNEVASLAPETIASSSSQIERIITQLKEIQEKKSTPLDVVCSMVCSK